MPALILDCDGVLADTERDGHRPAFNDTFDELGLPVHWSDAEYADKLKIGGGKERMASLLTDRFIADNGLPSDAAGPGRDARRLAPSQDRALQGDRRATASFPDGPGSLGSRPRRPTPAGRWPSPRPRPRSRFAPCSITPSAPSWRLRFSVFAGDIVPAKKPDPAIYELALSELACAPTDAIVIEDSRNGLLAAVGAGLRCVVTVSSYTADEDMREAALVVSSLGDPGPPRAGAGQPQRRPSRRAGDARRPRPLPHPTPG